MSISNLVIKPYQETHFSGCVDLIMSTWDFHSEFVGIRDTRIVYEYYLHNCLNWNHHLELVIDDRERVIGILFGSKEGINFLEELKFARKDKQINKWKNKKLIAGEFGDKQIAKKLLARFSLNDSLGEEDACLFDGEVNLFIVTSELQGRGLGKLLMDRYVDFCRFHNLNNVFLWTDMNCNYKFYTKYGFSLHKRFKAYLSDGTKSNIKNGMIFSLNIG